jgi:hypothetical protein
MPLLPLPSGDVAIDGGDLPVSSTDDVLDAFPSFFRRVKSAPVRDGLVAAITAMCLSYQSRASFAAAQSDVLRAEGAALDAFGKAVEIFRQPGEFDEPYRLRIIGLPDLVTPAAIIAATNAILAPYTPILAQYMESIQDRWFLNHASTNGSTWHSYVWRTTQSRAPTYLERLYPQDASRNDGFVRQQSTPGGARVFRDMLGREFLLRVPDITRIDNIGAFVRRRTSYAANPLVSPPTAPGVFVGTGVSFNNTTFVRKSAMPAQAVYQAIANTIDKIKGHSIRWVLEIDPKLK